MKNDYAGMQLMPFLCAAENAAIDTRRAILRDGSCQYSSVTGTGIASIYGNSMRRPSGSTVFSFYSWYRKRGDWVFFCRLKNEKIYFSIVVNFILMDYNVNKGI